MEKIRINIYKGKEYKQIIARRDCMLAEVAYIYFGKTGLNENDRPQFYFDGKKIPINSPRSLDELNIKDGARIDVVIPNDTKNLETISKEILSQKIFNKEILQLKDENKKLRTEINDLKNKLYEKEIINQDLNIKIKELKKRDTGNSSSLNEKIINLYEELRKKDQKIEELKEMLKRYPIELSENERLMSLIITSSDQKINYSIICKNTDKFIKIEGMIYSEYPEYEELSNYFISNGKKINKFRTLEENQIRNSDIITLFLIDE